MFVIKTRYTVCISYTGNIWQGKFWQTMQVKAIGKEKFGEQATVSVYAIYVFCISVNIGKENLGKWLVIHQIRQFFLLPKFSHVQYSRLKPGQCQ